MKKLLYIILLLTLTACSDKTQQELASVRQELGNTKQTLIEKTAALNNLQKELSQKDSQLKEAYAQIDSLKVTPEMLLDQSRKLMGQNPEKAFSPLESVIARYPNTQYATQATNLKDQIISNINKKKKEEEQRLSMGWKGLKDQKIFKLKKLTYTVKSQSTSNNWIYDRLRDSGRYFYSQADRGNKFLIMNVAVSSEDSNPDLMPLSVYRINGDTLNLISPMDYRFYSWEDYGTYLGNYSDSSNDFAKTKTIKFSIGVELSTKDLEQPLVIVTSDNPCITRYWERFSQPPVSYSSTNSCNVPSSIKVNEITDKLRVIKIINRNKL